MPTPPVKFPKPNRNPGKPPVRKGDGNGNGSGAGPGSEQNWRGLILAVLTVMSLLALYSAFLHPGIAQQEMSQAQLFQLIKDGKVTSIVNEPDPSTGIRLFTGTYKKPANATPGAPDVEAAFKVPVDLAVYPDIAKKLEAAGYTKIIETQNNTNIIWPLIINFLPIVLFVGLMYFLFRQQIRMAGKSAFSFGKSKARMMTRDRNKVTFKDVAGIDEAKEELSEIVEFLKDPAPVPAARRTHPQGRPHDRPSRHRQDPSGQGHRGRGGRALLQHQRLRFRGDVRRRRRVPRAGHVRAGQEKRALPDLHR